MSPVTWSLAAIVPLLMALALGIGVTTLHRRLPPATAARVVLATLIVVMVAVLPTMWAVAVGSLAHVPMVAGAVEWCSSYVGMGQDGSTLGTITMVSVAAIAIVSAVLVARVIRAHRRLRHHRPAPVEVAEHHALFAVTLPGRGGRVVVSRALVDMLDSDELGVVIAHEEAHAAHRHDRYLLVAQLGVASFPVLYPLTQRLQFVLERWADEVAAQRCGDRRLAARTLGKVALGIDASRTHGVSKVPVGAAHFARWGVTERVSALLVAPPPVPAPRTMVVVWSAIGLTAVFALVQLHHLATVLLACVG
jgi:Peptidase family M48